MRKDRWLALKPAAALLGVDETTLRQWADQGKVRAFRTPGGHRRFREVDVRALLRPSRTGADEQVADTLRHRAAHLVSGLPGRRLKEAPWFARLSPAFRAHARQYGHQTVELLVQSLGGRVAVGKLRAEMRRLGVRYGQELRGSELSLPQAAEAFCFFRDLALARCAEALPSGARSADLLRRVSRLLDEMLLGIARAYDARAEAT